MTRDEFKRYCDSERDQISGAFKLLGAIFGFQQKQTLDIDTRMRALWDATVDEVWEAHPDPENADAAVLREIVLAKGKARVMEARMAEIAKRQRGRMH